MRLHHGVPGLIQPKSRLTSGDTLQYPDNFDTPTFPAGRRIALSRFVAIGNMVMFLIALFLCILVGWAVRSRSVDPFVISVDQTTGAWTIVGHSHGQFEYSAYRTLQESVAIQFVRDWFTISANNAENAANWNGNCDRATQCDAGIADSNACTIFCACDDDVFESFVKNTLPQYRIRTEYGEYWTVDVTGIRTEPVSEITSNGGKWRVRATVNTTQWTIDGMTNGEMEIIAFITVARSAMNHARTMGYYISEFNSYVITQ